MAGKQGTKPDPKTISSQTAAGVGSKNLEVKVDEFFSITTMHGLADVYRAKGLRFRLLWLTIFLMAVCAAIYGCYAIIAEYAQGPVVVSYMVSDNRSLVLPDIVICPFNRFNQSFLDEYNVSEDIAQYMELSYMHSHYLDFQAEEIKRILAKINDTAEAMDRFLFKLQMTFTEFIKAATLNCSAFFVQPKNCEVFESFMTSTGLCYRILVNKTQGPQTVPGFGLDRARVILSIPRHLYSSPLNQWLTDGIVVKLAEEGRGIDTDLTFIPAGVHALLPLKATKYEFMNDPPRYECIPNNRNNHKYSRVSCFDECMVEEASGVCNCSPAAMAKPQKPTTCTTKQLLDCYLPAIIPVFFEISGNPTMGRCRQRCRPLCSYWEFVPALSYANFPAPHAQKIVPDNKTWEDLQNHIILEVFHQHLEYTLIKHYPSMTADSFIAQIGGQVSLWMGASILTVIQLLIFLFQVICARKKIPHYNPCVVADAFGRKQHGNLGVSSQIQSSMQNPPKAQNTEGLF